MLIVRALAPAKINLGLEILGRRDDGFHEIRTIMSTVSLFDRIQIAKPGQPMIAIFPALMDETNNSIADAARLLRAKRRRFVASIGVWKRIPIAAGLGGGSSDAAATLIVCNLCHQLACTREELQSYAAELGSDVPYFLTGGLALASGRGEKTTPLRSTVPTNAVIVAPRVAIPSKTRTLYGLLQDSDFSDGGRVEAMSEMVISTFDEDALQNAFERPLYDLEPSLRAIPAIMRKHGAVTVALSGAGPAHYALEMDRDKARAMASGIRDALGRAASVHLVRLIPHGIITTTSNE